MCARETSPDVRAGQPIPGSKYVRAFCHCCGAAMRVSKGLFKSGRYADCDECNRPSLIGGGNRAPDRKYDGQWDNVVRAIEDQ